MPALINSSGTWKNITSMFINVSGTWKNITAGFINVGGVWKQFFGAAAPTAPAQVTGLTATDFGTSRSYNNGRIDLLWTAPSNGGSPITGYFIEYSINGVTFFTLVSNTGTTSTSYTDTGLTSAQIYYYRVSAINAIGTGTASSAASATATTVPQTPTINSVSVVTSTQVTVTWSGATGGKSLTLLSFASSPALSLSYGGTSSPIAVSGSFAVNTAYTLTMSATNANGTSGTSAASGSFTPNVVSPPVLTVAPVVTPSSGTAGVTTYSCTTGTWTNSPTSYSYQWQSFDTPTYITAPGTSTNSTYTPPSNYFTLGYQSPIRCRVTATNAAGSTQAFSNTASVSPPLSPPSGGSVTLSGSGVAGTVLTASTSGWSNSPTSYSVRIYASVSNPPTTSDILKADSSGASSVTYTVTTFDASPPAYYFKAFATATNGAGTSSEVGSGVILSSLGAPSTPGTPTMTYDGGNSTPSNWAYDITWTASTGGGTIQYQLDCQASNNQSTILSTATRPSSGFYSSTSQQDVLLSRTYTFWRCRARATNDGGSSWSSYSDWSNWA